MNGQDMSIFLITSGLLFSTALANAGNRLSLDKGVLVHLFEWKYDDIASECETFLKPYGFVGLVISPPNENLVCPNRPWWERYQPVSYKLVTRSGNEDQLKTMLERCNHAGIRVIADVVLNHMAGGLTEPVGTAGSKFDHRNFDHPDVPYNKDDFHSICDAQNYNNKDEVRNCELVGLHDLNQSKENVRNSMVDYMNKLVSIGFAGFRIDAAKHMHPDDIRVMLNRVNKLSTKHGFPENTHAFVFLEVIDLGYEPITFDEYQDMGLVTDFKYGQKLGERFRDCEKYPLNALQSFGTSWKLVPDDIALVFINNHDTQRDKKLGKDHLNINEAEPYKLAVAFMLAWTWGTPKIFSGYRYESKEDGPPSDGHPYYNILSPNPVNNECQNRWACEHRWRQIYNMVHFHNVVKGTELKWKDNGRNQIEFCRGNKGFIVINMENSFLKRTFQTCLPKGVYCDVISGNLVDGQCSGKKVTVDDNGEGEIEVYAYPTNDPHKDAVVALHVEEREVCLATEEPGCTTYANPSSNMGPSEFSQKTIHLKIDMIYHPQSNSIEYEVKEVSHEGKFLPPSGKVFDQKTVHLETDIFYYPNSDTVTFEIQEIKD